MDVEATSQYYWEALDLQVVPWDGRYHAPIRHANVTVDDVPELASIIPYELSPPTGARR
jgi:hypothetical protein